MKTRFKQGDTIIEVTLAISIFAMMMVGGLTIMNNGLAKAQGAVQLTMARNNIDSQAEALRYINGAYIAQYPNINNDVAKEWEKITQNTAAAASNLNSCRTDFSPSNVFVIDTQTAMKTKTNLKVASTYPRLLYTYSGANASLVANNDTNVIMNKASYIGAEGIWIEAIKSSSSTQNNYYDFHIRACWKATGSNVNTTLGTIVRLYDPRG